MSTPENLFCEKCNEHVGCESEDCACRCDSHCLYRYFVGDGNYVSGKVTVIADNHQVGDERMRILAAHSAHAGGMVAWVEGNGDPFLIGEGENISPAYAAHMLDIDLSEIEAALRTMGYESFDLTDNERGLISHYESTRAEVR